MIDIFTIDPKDMEILEAQNIKTSDPAAVLTIAHETDMDILFNWEGIKTVYDSMGYAEELDTIKTDIDNALTAKINIATEGALREYIKTIYGGTPKAKAEPKAEADKRYTFQKNADTQELILKATAMLEAYENLFPGKIALAKKQMEGVNHDA